MTTFFSIRAFVEIVSERVSSLRTMAKLQSQVKGNLEDKKKRLVALRRKAYGLAMELSVSFIGTVFSSASLVLFGSLFSSRQFIIHMTAMIPHIVVTTSVVVVVVYRGIYKAQRQHRAMLKASIAIEGVGVDI
jgi:hypothetical protein